MELTMQAYEEASQAARSHESFPALEARLLAVGGTRVVPSPDPHIMRYYDLKTNWNRVEQHLEDADLQSI